jgi:three-Cys-motif partner protein
MQLKPINNVNEFKKQFLISFQQTRAENQFLNSFIYETSLLGKLFIVGGYLRSIANQEIPRDLDIIVNIGQDKLDHIVETVFQNYHKNRMGGYKVSLDKIAIDIWSTENNWAFKERLVKNFEQNYVEKIGEGTFFNYDSLVIDLHSFQCNFKHYNTCAKANQLDIIQKNSNYKRLNPTREANVLRAFYLMEKYQLTLSEQLVSYIINTLNYSNDLYGNHTGKLLLTLVKYEKYQSILSHKRIENIVAKIYETLSKDNLGENSNLRLFGSPETKEITPYYFNLQNPKKLNKLAARKDNMKFDPIQYVDNDNLVLPEIGIWGLQKYKLLGDYCNIFTSGMKNNWEQLIYIDLFAGAGYAKIKDENRVLLTSALIAASIPHKFTKYIVSEFDKNKMDALKRRVERQAQDLNIAFVEGDSNRNVDTIISHIPKDSNALRFCFVDPYSLNLEFETIRKIASVGKVDFLILLALPMDGKRNFHNYIQDESDKIDRFIGNSEWRGPFRKGEIRQQDFIKYLADAYDKNMSGLGYVVNPALKYQVKNDEANLPLYYLAFYSKNERGNDFYKKIEKYQSVQLKMF